MSEPIVYAIATMDTKGEELQWVLDCLRAAGVSVRSVDVSTQHTSTITPDITSDSIAAASGRTISEIRQLDRGAAVTAMSEALTAFMMQQQAAGNVTGVLGIGGSGGTALITAAMRMMPIGMPKLMVSTVASGNTAAYVDCSDICMMYSVVDVAGLNGVSCRVLGNAAHAMAGMVQQILPSAHVKPAVGITMFGVTTACATAVRKALELRGFDCLVFHATGTGGRAMEKLVDSGLIQGVLDITTTEVADEIAGGVFPGGPDRFDAILRKQIPYVISTGALDMVNFGPMQTVPEKYRTRQFHQHNAQVTLMRTSPEENRKAGEWIAGKLNRATSPVVLLIPEKGVSALDQEGQPFYALATDQVLFDVLQSELETNALIQIHRLPLHINDPEFASVIVDEFLRQYESRGS